MKIGSLTEIIPILQIAVGPVILTSGVGLFLLTITNRLGRVIDRVRSLSREAKSTADQKTRVLIDSQITILFQQARFIRFSILMAYFSILFSCLLVIVLFLFSVIGMNMGPVIVIVFTLSLSSLLVAVVAALRDINLSLKALRIEVGVEK